MASSNEMKYKGVRKRKWGKWVSEIRLPNSRDRIWLGSYDSPEKAARAFDAALFCLRGDRAHFNFPDTPFLFHLPPDHHHHSLSPHQIQLLASTFANQLQASVSILDDTTSSSSSSAPLDHSDEVVEEGHVQGIDWSFLKSLDSNDDVVAAASDYALYDYEDHFGEFPLQMQCPTSPPPVYHSALEYQPDDPFSHHSFLWNFGHDSLQ